MAHAAESLHWYTRNGETAYEVKGANGNMRPTTLRDARKLNLVPSVTSIIKCAAAPGLELWKAKQLMMAALTLPRNVGESEDDWLKRVQQDSKEQARKAAARGTEIHAAIQGYFENGSWELGMEPYIEGIAVALKPIGTQKWAPEVSFAHGLGFGGKVDLSSPEWVIDFKTKEFAKDAQLDTYDEHAMQLAAYRVGLDLPKARCAIVYVSVTEPGYARLIEIEQPKLYDGWEMFQGLLAYWKAKNKYESGWMEKAA